MMKARHFVCTTLLAACPALAICAEPDWSMGAYAGKYYDSEPAGFVSGRANFLDHYLVAFTASKTVWRSQSWPVSIEIDAMVGQQSGLANLGEIAIAPAVRINAFNWPDVLKLDFRLAPLGLSYTTSVSPLERGAEGQGARTLNWLFLEMALSRPQQPKDELFFRLHHRCTVYDLLNNYGANGEDFFTMGWRRRF